MHMEASRETEHGTCKVRSEVVSECRVGESDGYSRRRELSDPPVVPPTRESLAPPSKTPRKPMDAEDE